MEPKTVLDIVKTFNKAPEVWDWIVTQFQGKKTTIAITGMAGAGKTVLFDHLTGAAYSQGYVLPEKSDGPERGAATNQKPEIKQRLALVTVPGDTSSTRLTTLDSLFGGRTSVGGVVHVVCNGYASTRSQVAQQVLVENLGLDSVEKYRQHQLAVELEDLRETLEAVRASVRRTKQPTWLILAVDKMDLYSGEAIQAMSQYDLLGNGACSKLLATFRTQVGTDNVRIDTWSGASLPQTFEWNGEVVQPQMSREVCNKSIVELARKIAVLCHGV